MQQLEMVFNELSSWTKSPYEPVTTDRQKARDIMSIFVKTLSTAVNSGVKTLRTQSDIYAIILSPSYPVANWVNDNDIDEDERNLFLALETERPLLANLIDEKIKNQADCFECKQNGKEAKGLGMAYLLEALPVSFNSDQQWDSSYLTLDITQLDENDENNELKLIEERLKIVHASRSQHIQEHSSWIENRIRNGVRDGEDLWQRRDELFPHLGFCQAVQPQICGLRSGDPMLTQVSKRLLELEKSSQNWTEAGFKLDTIPSKSTPESQSRLQKFKNQLTIQCPDSELRLFSLHLRMTPGAWRLYFFPLTPGTILIGYVDQKLL